MDLYTRLLLGVTAVAVLGLVYGNCASDPDCHSRSCAGGRQLCGVVYSHVQDRPAP